jgi:hypothetical protein
MSDRTFLDRLTLVGWLLLIGSAAGLTIGGPAAWAALSPETLAQASRYGRLMALIFVAALTVCFAAGSIVLELAGIHVFRRLPKGISTGEPDETAGDAARGHAGNQE